MTGTASDDQNSPHNIANKVESMLYWLFSTLLRHEINYLGYLGQYVHIKQQLSFYIDTHSREKFMCAILR